MTDPSKLPGVVGGSMDPSMMEQMRAHPCIMKWMTDPSKLAMKQMTDPSKTAGVMGGTMMRDPSKMAGVRS
eukprot:2842987-Alexandrium_andersonii.AAC.1